MNMHPQSGLPSTGDALLNPDVTFDKADNNPTENIPCHLIYSLPPPPLQRWRFVTAIWLGLTAVVSCTGICCLLQPSWFQRRSPITNVEIFKFGLFSYCVRDVVRTDGEICRFYDPKMRLEKFPGTAFAIAFVLFCVGCVMESFVVVTNLLTLRLQEKMNWTRSCVFLSGYAQCISSALLLSSLIILPMGLAEKMIQEHCSGELTSVRTKMFWAGECGVGWAYSLSCVIVAISFFLPFLARFSLKPSMYYFHSV